MAKKIIATELAMAVGAAAGSAVARKRSTTAKHSKAKVTAAPAEDTEVEEMTAVDHGEIERLAYLFYEARGGENGSPEQDWLQAEQELTARATR